MIPLAILGGGGHARVVIDAVRSTGRFRILGIVDDRLEPGTDAIDGVPILGPISRNLLRDHDLRQAIVAIGDNRVRLRIATELDEQVEWATVIHAHAYVAAGATIAPGSVVCAGAIVQPGACIGRHVVLNTSCSVDHDCEIQDLAQIGPGAHLGGRVTVECGAFIGIGASVLPQLTIGSGATIGAGAAVIRDVPANVTAVGVPAQVIATKPDAWPDS